MSFAELLIESISSFTSASSASDTRSSLLSRMRSANATCCTASLTASSGLTSRRCWVTFLASTRVTMQSIRKLSWSVASLLKVWMIGAGSARPVVSSMIAWKSLRRTMSELRVRTRSPRTVQQTQPLSMETMSSFVARFSVTRPSSMFTSPGSVTRRRHAGASPYVRAGCGVWGMGGRGVIHDAVWVVGHWHRWFVYALPELAYSGGHVRHRHRRRRAGRRPPPRRPVLRISQRRC
mmetsp:Transcript_55295/g.152248  ORF Transcript_55295/g.152248 Transcript_55295/m.152248 type:complete len:236 (+) Transcript_55295:272-979(+)